MSLFKLGVFFLYIYVAIVMQMTAQTAHGKLICACTTPACNDTGRITCNAVTSCYTQYLDRGDGSSPVTRGCIDDTTPLLCENRRPFVPVTPWPHLQCCKQPMCNADNGIVTAPTWPKKITETTTTAQVFQLEEGFHRNSKRPSEKSQPRTEENFQHPAFIIILPVITICLFAMLIIVIVVVVRQSRRRHRTGEFGANINNTGLPVANCRGNFYGTGDSYIREKFFQSVQV